MKLVPNVPVKEPNYVYYDLCGILNAHGEETEPRGRKTKEIHPVFTSIVNPRKRIISDIGRVVNLPFAMAEVVQILTGQNDAQALKYYNSKIIEIQGDSPDATRFNAAYGERLRRFNMAGLLEVDQLQHVVETLRADPDSRQASIVLSHPQHDNYRQVTKDRACNVYAHAMIRDDKLDWLHVIRSNDIIWGLPYNFIQWMHVQEYVATALGVPMGKFNLLQDSLHVYEEFYDDLENVRWFDLYEQFGDDEYFGMTLNVDDVARAERNIRTTGIPIAFGRNRKQLDYWTEVAYLFNSFCVFKQRQDLKVWSWLPYTFELRFPLIRFMINVRWNRGKDNQVYARCRQMAVDDLLKNTKLTLEQALAYFGLAPDMV